MSADVIVLAGDAKYLNHMKATAVNCRREGAWSGDICFLLSPDMVGLQEDLQARGITTVIGSRDGYYLKFSLFRPWFRRWRRAFYMDSDIIVQRPLAPLFELDIPDVLVMDREPFTLLHSFSYWDDGRALAMRPDLAEVLWAMRKPTTLGFNTGFVLWQPDRLPFDAEQKLTELEALLRPINVHNGKGTDQSIINVYLHDRITDVPDKLFGYWSTANEVDSKTVAVHYCSWYAPWLVKPPTDESHTNPVLRRACREVYESSLNSFDQVFPRK